ncbi:YrhA family protein [Paenibacillus alvei]
MFQWTKFLDDIRKIEEKYGSSLRSPVADAEIIKMNHKIKDELGDVVLPSSYIEFLKNINGLDFNGLVIYGVDENLLDREVKEDIHGFIEINELWHENDWQKQYIFFGDSDTAWYCYDQKEGLYVELDKPSGTLMESFESFDTMLSNALETTLL